MVLRPFGEHISPECDGSGNMMCVFSESLDRLGEFLGVKINVGHGMLILTSSNHFFMFPEPSHSGEICSPKDRNTILPYLYF